MGYGRKHPDSRLPQDPGLSGGTKIIRRPAKLVDYSGALPANLRRVEIVTSNPSWDPF